MDTFSYLISEGFRSLWRTKVNAVISIIVIGVTMSFVGFGGVIGQEFNRLIETARSKYKLEVFFSPLLTDGEANLKIQEISQLPFVLSAKLITKQEAAEIFEEEFGENIFDLLLENPLPSSCVVKIKSAGSEKLDINPMIEKIKSHKIEIVGVELGSELSNRTFFAKGYTIDKYIDSAIKCSKKIKQQFPDIKTAVVAAPLVNKKNHRHTIWNNKLAKMDFYDAIIIHSYAKVIKGKKEFGQMLTEIPEGDSKEEAFDIYKTRVIKYFSEDYPKEVEAYHTLFKKSIWVTEWNLQISWTTGNTMLQSLYVANYFLELLWNSDLNSINLSTYHNMGGRDYSGSIFRINKEVLEMQSTYYPLKFIGQIFNVKNLNIKKELISENVFEYLIFSNEKLIYSCFLNWNSIDVIIEFKATKKINLDAYFSENLFDKANIIGELSTEKKVNQSINSIKIKPNSVTLISYLNE